MADLARNYRKYRNRFEVLPPEESGDSARLSPAEVQAMERRNAEREVCLRCTRPKCSGEAVCFRNEQLRQAGLDVSERGRKAQEITYAGETHTVAEWARITGIEYSTLWCRIRAGWPMEKVMTPKGKGEKVKSGRKNHHVRILEYRGEAHSVTEWAEILDMNVHTLHSRIRRGLSVEEVLTEPVKDMGRRIRKRENDE